MNITLKQILNLVGKLDDSPGEDTSRERFRRYLTENVKDIGSVRDYIEECLRSTGTQYNRALQDLVNYLGMFLGFEVCYGRYKGVQGEIGYDGLWKSPSGIHIVVEVKTSETYSIKTSTLIGYIDQLISYQTIPGWKYALGLYAIGKPDDEIKQLENAIIVENRTPQLRIISVQYLISLAEMMQVFDVSHSDGLSIIRPSGPKVDPLVDIMTRLISQRPEESIVEVEEVKKEKNSVDKSYWLTSARSDEEQSAEEIIYTLVGQEFIYAFTDRTPGVKDMKEGDLICFYAAGKGVVAHAIISSKPVEKEHPKVRESDRYKWVVELNENKVYTDNPVIIDASLRNQLEAFKGRDTSKPWSWFVQATRKVSQVDFEILTGCN